jgi:mono/diheme cytochrome c family protein
MAALKLRGRLNGCCFMKKRFYSALPPLLLAWVLASAFHPSIYEPGVPKDSLEREQENENPFPASRERIQLGREIYFGKGLCVTCHGKDGKGIKIPGHSPRDFTDKKWQEARTDGELMWVLRNGSPGTSMPVRVGKVISEEEGWSAIHFIRTFPGK